MQSRHVLPLLMVFAWLAAVVAGAAQFKLNDGTVINGEASSFNDDGLIIRLTVGGFSERIAWIRFTQDSLKELAKDTKNAKFVEPFIEIPPEVIAKQREKIITLKEVPRVPRVRENAGVFSALTTPVSLVILGLLFLANLLAGYEVAVFRNRPTAMVCCVSALLPVAGPVLFLALPSAPEEGEIPDTIPLTGTHGEAAPAAGGGQGSVTSKLKSKITGIFGKKSGGGLSLAAGEKSGAAGGPFQTKVYPKGEYTFNRRFFETQFPGFFRVVPSETEKDLIIVIRAGRSEYVGKRITRISMNELHLQLLSGGEVPVAFADMSQVQIRHKDAKT